MREFKKDFLDRLLHIPTSILGFIILIIGFILVYQKIITMQEMIGFSVISLPFFFYKKDTPKQEDKE